MLDKQQKLTQIDHFFTYSDTLDVALLDQQFKVQTKNSSKSHKTDISVYLDMLETVYLEDLQKAICGLYLHCIQSYEDLLKLNYPQIEAVYNSDGLAQILGNLPRLVDALYMVLENDTADTLQIEQELRAALNLTYLVILWNMDSPTICDELIESPLEVVLLDILRLSLDVYFIPVKKIVMLTTLYFSIVFPASSPKTNDTKFLTTDNVKDINKDEPRLFLEDPTQIELFYQRAIVKEQKVQKLQGFIRAVVTALLAITPQNNRNKLQLDVNREWESAYLLHESLFEPGAIPKSKLPLPSKINEQYIAYKALKKIPENIKDTNMDPNVPAQPVIVNERDRHKIIIGHAVVSLFDLLIQRFSTHNLFQYLHVIQTISDENCVLVFRNLLALNFNYLASPQYPCIHDFRDTQKDYHDIAHDFVYKTTKLMYKVCRGSTEKIDSNLIESYAYSLVKKMPNLFKDSPKIASVCNHLLKIQTKQFTKKMRQVPANMKIIAKIYCKENNFEKIEKQRMKEAQMAHMAENFKQEDIKKLLTEFNNYNYLKVKTKPEKPVNSQEISESIGEMYKRLWDSVELPKDFANNYEKWLEDNVWEYYD